MNARRRSYEGVVAPTALYGAETWNARQNKRKRLNVLEMSRLRRTVGVRRMD